MGTNVLNSQSNYDSGWTAADNVAGRNMIFPHNLGTTPYNISVLFSPDQETIFPLLWSWLYSASGGPASIWADSKNITLSIPTGTPLFGKWDANSNQWTYWKSGFFRVFASGLQSSMESGTYEASISLLGLDFLSTATVDNIEKPTISSDARNWTMNGKPTETQKITTTLQLSSGSELYLSYDLEGTNPYPVTLSSSTKSTFLIGGTLPVNNTWPITDSSGEAFLAWDGKQLIMTKNPDMTTPYAWTINAI